MASRQAIPTLDGIDHCLDIVAELIDLGETQYLALFERLEQERDALAQPDSVEGRVAARLKRRRDKAAEPDQTAEQSSRAA